MAYIETRLLRCLLRRWLAASARNDSRVIVGGEAPKQSQKPSHMDKQYYVYIMTNKTHTTLYTGVTRDLVRRVYEHREKLADGFTKKYNVVKLVYYEVFAHVEDAINREKQIKAGSRQKKLQSINRMNKEWRDLYKEL
jgi:putative endonuclease